MPSMFQIEKKNHHNNIMESLPLTLPDQMLQVHKVLHMLQHLEVQLRHYSDFPVQVLFLETALNKENKVAKVISNGSWIGIQIMYRKAFESNRES